jgi:hypothetical protein
LPDARSWPSCFWRVAAPTFHASTWGFVCASPTITSGRVYRETVVDHKHVDDPCVLVVAFRLRGVHGPAHALFRWESLLNTVLFVGFPGLVSKLWLATDEDEGYRGVYEWDGPQQAEHYARCLWRVLALVSEPDSIHYVVLPGLRREDVINNPQVLNGGESEGGPAWWRVTAAA